MFKNIEKKQKIIDEQQKLTEKRKNKIGKHSDDEDENAIFTDTFINQLNKAGSTIEQSVSQASDSFLQSYLKCSNKISNDEVKNGNFQEMLEKCLLSNSISFNADKKKAKAKVPPIDNYLEPSNSLKPNSVPMHHATGSTKSTPSKIISILPHKSSSGKQLQSYQSEINKPCIQVPNTVRNSIKFSEKKISVNSKQDISPFLPDKPATNRVNKVSSSDRPIIVARNIYTDDNKPIIQRERESLEYYSPMMKESIRDIKATTKEEPCSKYSKGKRESPISAIRVLEPPIIGAIKSPNQVLHKSDDEFQKMMANLRLKSGNTDYKGVYGPGTNFHGKETLLKSIGSEDGKVIVLQSRNSKTPYQAVTHKSGNRIEERKSAHGKELYFAKNNDCFNNQMLVKRTTLELNQNSKVTNSKVALQKAQSQGKIIQDPLSSIKITKTQLQPQSMKYSNEKRMMFSKSVSAFEKHKSKELIGTANMLKEGSNKKMTQRRSASKGNYDIPFSVLSRRK